METELLFQFKGLKLPEKTPGTIALLKSLDLEQCLILRWHTDTASASEDYLVTHTTQVIPSLDADNLILTLQHPEAQLCFQLQRGDEIYITTLAAAVESLATTTPSPKPSPVTATPSVTHIPIDHLVTTDLLLSLLKDQQATQESFELLPAAFRSREGFIEVVRSAQLRHTARCLNEALISPELPALFAALKLDPSGIYNPSHPDPTLALIRSLESKHSE